MSISMVLLLVLLVLLLIAVSRRGVWTLTPSYVIGAALVIILLLVLTGRI